MAVESISHSEFVINPNAPRATELARLRDCLGSIVARTIQSMAQVTENAASNYQKDVHQLDTGIWYPTPYAKACTIAHQTARLKFLQEKGGFTHGYLSGKHFDRLLNDKGERFFFAWKVKEGVLPSEALSAATSGVSDTICGISTADMCDKGPRFSIVDCGAVCTMAQYTALLGVLGKIKFDRLFSSAHGQPLVIEYSEHKLQPMSYFLSFTPATEFTAPKGSEGHRDLKQGQIVSFNNHPDYKKKFPYGMAENYNASCFNPTPGQQTFVAHGLPHQGISEHKMNLFLASRYNQDSSDDFLRFTTEVQPLCQKEITEKRKFIKEKIDVKEVPGLDCYSFMDFNIGLVFDLVQTPVEKVDIELVQQHPEAKSSIERIEKKRSMQEGCLIS